MANDAVVIMTTVKDRGDAKAMAAHLIKERFAACVQEIEINSHFNWDGKINDEPEVLLLIKTSADRAEEAVAEIKKKHTYDIPEILVSPTIGGFGPYLQWLKDETREQSV